MKKQRNNASKREGKQKNYMKYIMIILYLILTVSGLILYKKGANQEMLINISNGSFNLKISLISLLGLVCYLFSFLIYMLILPKFDLTFIYPILNSISYISIYILSVFVLKETFTVNGLVGTLIIIVGIIVINLGK